MITKTTRVMLLAGLMLTVLMSNVEAQVVNREKPTQVGLELGGRAFLYSFNLERYFTSRAAIGVGAAAWGMNDGALLLVPTYVSFNPIGNTHSLYLSAGATVGVGTKDFFDQRAGVLGSQALGYQYTSAGGLVIRPTFNVFHTLHEKLFWGGFTIGRRF